MIKKSKKKKAKDKEQFNRKQLEIKLYRAIIAELVTIITNAGIALKPELIKILQQCFFMPGEKDDGREEGKEENNKENDSKKEIKENE